LEDTWVLRRAEIEQGHRAYDGKRKTETAYAGLWTGGLTYPKLVSADL